MIGAGVIKEQGILKERESKAKSYGNCKQASEK
jgi:hypothetical protein